MLSPTAGEGEVSSLKDIIAPFTTNYDEGAYIQALLVSQNVASVLQGLQQVIQRIDGEIHRQVVSHHKDLFQQMAQICEIESKLLATTTRLKHLQKSVSRLNQGALRPFSVMQKTTSELRNLNSVTDMLRSVSRVTYLVERLKVTMKLGEKNSDEVVISLSGVSVREMTKAAVYLTEIKNILEETNLTGVHATAQHLALCDSLNVSVRQFASAQLAQGLSTQSMDDIAGALQIFFNFGELYKVVQEAIDAAEKKITASFRKMLDVSTIGDTSKIGTKPGGRTGREAVNASNFRVALWDRVDALSEELFDHVLQIWTFQRVLMRKQDPLTFVVFIDAYNQERKIHEQESKIPEELKSLSLLETFWIRLTSIIQAELTHGSQTSHFIRNVFMNDYPRLASIFETLFSRIVKQLGTSLSSPSLAAASSQTNEEKAFGAQSREALLKSLQVFRTGFLAFSLKELTEPVNLMFSSGQMVPSRSDVSALTVKMHEQMALVKDSQPELQDPVCEGLVQAVTLFQSKCLGMLQKDIDSAVWRGAVPGALRTNSEIFNITCFLVKEFHPINLKKSWGELSTAAAGRMEQCWNILQSLADSVMTTVTSSFLTSAQDAFKLMNKEDFGVSALVQVDGSSYIQAFRSQVTTLLGPVLSLFQYSSLTAPSDAMNPTHMRSRTVLDHLGKLQKAVAESFVLHASLVYPLKDQGKLKLAADTGALETSLRSLTPKAAPQDADPLSILQFFKEVMLADIERLRSVVDNLQFVQTPQANVQRVCLAQYLFGCAGLPRSSPALVLELPPEIYVQKVSSLLLQQPEEVFSMLRKVYTKLESQIKIPVGPEGRDFIANNRVHLHLAMLLLPKP